MSTPRKYLVLGVAAAVLVAGGFLLLRPKPAPRVETTATAEVHQEASTQQAEVKREIRHRVVRTETKPDGGTVKIETEDVQVDTGTVTKADTRTDAKTEERRVVEPARPDWRVGAQAGWSRLQVRPDLYGVSVERRVAGSVWVGGWARTDKTFGVSLAVEF